jgi:uncharacterized protein involved in exopolysaccharide biosynthesis
MQASSYSAQHNVSRSWLVTMVRKYWPVVLITTLSGILGMYVVLQVFFTEIYETNTRLLVKVGRENVETPPTVRNGQMFSQGVRIADINSEVQILSSQVLLEKVVQDLGPQRFQSVLLPPESIWGYPKYLAKRVASLAKNTYKEFLILVALEKRVTPEQDALLRLIDGVKVEPVKESDVLVLKVGTPSPQLCVDVANSLLSTYLAERTAVRRGPAGSDFFASRMNEAADRMAKLEKERATVRQKFAVSAPEEQRTSYLRQIATLESEIYQNEAELTKLREQTVRMDQKTSSLPEMVLKERVEAPNPTIQSLQERITALRLERAKLASRYQPDSTMITKIDGEIGELEATMKRERETVINAVTTQTNPTRREFSAGLDMQGIQIAGLQGRTAYLKGPVEQLREQVRRVDRAADELERADREFKRAEQDYLFYAKRLEEARMSEELDSQRVTNVSIIERPETPILPVAPKKRFLMGIAIGVALALGIGLSALLESIEDRIQASDDILDLPGLPYLGTVALGERS